MSERDRLRDKLGKLGGDAGPPWIGAGSAADLLKGVARVVDETVLPRAVTLSGARSEVVLTIAKRRLIAVGGDVTAAFDSDDAGPILERLGRDLAEAFRGDARVSVRAVHAEVAPDLQGAALSVSAICAAWGIDLYAPDTAGLDGGFASAAALLKAKAFSWVLWDHGAVADEGGDPEYMKVLKSKISPAKLRAQHGGPKGLLMVGGNSFATAIGLVWDGNHEIGFVVGRIDLGAISRAFAAG